MNGPEKHEGTSVPPVCAEGADRVVHLTTVHHPFDPRIFHKQLGSLNEAGFDAHLVVPHHRAEHTKGVRIHPLSKPANRPQRFSLQPSAYRMARALGADLYQIHDPELIPLAYLLKRSTGAAVVYDMHEDYRGKGAVLGRGLRALERWGFGWVDHVLIAEESYRPIVDRHDVGHTYIANYVKALGAGAALPAPDGKTTGPPEQLLYTGTVAEKRGLFTMLDLAERIQEKRRPERLSIVGVCHHGHQRAAAEARIQGKGLQAVVDRTGWSEYVAPSTMSPHYHRADVGLALCEPHPNLVGSLLTKFYEYLHYGLPIICSDFPLWRRFVEKNDCGAVVPAGDVEAVLEVLARWRRCPEVYQSHVRNARAAAEQYRWKKMGQRLVQVYRELLSSTERKKG